MGYINQPLDLRRVFHDTSNRLEKLERAQRFTAPNVNFSTSTPTDPRIGDVFFDTNSNTLRYWNGTTWLYIGDNNLGTPVVSWTPTWAGTGLTFTGTPATGTYQRIGKQIHFNIQVSCATVTNFGTGQYSLTLPTGLAPGYDYVLHGGIHRVTPNTHWNIEADLAAGNTTMLMYHPTSNGAMDIFSYNKPFVLATTDVFYIGGNYLLA